MRALAECWVSSSSRDVSLSSNIDTKFVMFFVITLWREFVTLVNLICFEVSRLVSLSISVMRFMSAKRNGLKIVGIKKCPSLFCLGIDFNCLSSVSSSVNFLPRKRRN